MTSSTFFIILIFTALITVSVIMVYIPQMVFGEHIRQHGEYTIHPQKHFYDQFHEIYVIEVYIQSKSHPDCLTGYGLNERGECTDISRHYDVYPLYLREEMPTFCSEKALGCVADNAIHIINGKHNAIPYMGGCSVLWHEIMHIKLGFSDEYAEHMWMRENLPNERCAV